MILFLQTRLIATHNLHILPHVDRVLVIENGRIIEDGSYKELMWKRRKLFDYVRAYQQCQKGV